MKNLIPLTILLFLFACRKEIETVSFAPAGKLTAKQVASITLHPTEDVYVRSGKYANTNYGSDTLLTVKGCGGDYERYTYLKFDLPGGSVSKAVLRLYGSNTQDATPISVQIYNTTSPWSESTVTYSTRPSHPSTALASATITNEQKWYEWDVTEFLKEQSGTIGLMIKNTSNQNRRMDFSSREGANPPELLLNGATEAEQPVVDTGQYDRVVAVVLENEAAGSVFGSSKAPYINSLRAYGTSLTNFYSFGPHSQRNYVAWMAGQELITTNDCLDGNWNVANLYTSLKAAGKSFCWYSDGLPKDGSHVCSADGGLYRSKHNGTVGFSNIPASSNRPASVFDWQDSSKYRLLSNCVFYTPNMNDDGHDTGLAYADSYLKAKWAKFIAWCRNPANRTVFVVYWDEGSGTDKRIAVVMLGANVKQGYVNTATLNHYSFTKMIASHFGGGFIHANVSGAADIKNIWE